MRRRGCLIAVAVVAGLLLLCCVLAWFVGIPRLQDDIADGISDGLATTVADQFDTIDGTLEPGTYTISIDDIQSEIDTALGDTAGASDFEISVDSTGITIGFTSGSQEFGYSGRPVAENGELQIRDMEVNNSALRFLMPPDKMANVVEDAINGYFSSRGLAIESLELGNNEITVMAVESGN
jgi:hypothetical protein